MHMIRSVLRVALLGVVAMAAWGASEMRDTITHLGVTWTFDQPYETGRFITGDYWVVGPVTVVSVSPQPGPVDEDRMKAEANHWGDVILKPDPAMRNGSMVVLEPGARQAFDSRLKATFDPERGVSYPLELAVDRSLVSTVSHAMPGGDNLAAPIMWSSEKKLKSCLESGAILTCLAAAPPADAFRPPYVGTAKPIYRESQLRWELLGELEPVAGRPSWDELARYVERPWLDHLGSWTIQFLGPTENNPNYGREFSRITGLIALALNTAASREDKRDALIGLVQVGIDLKGALDAGMNWTADGGHYSGRKLSLLFAGMLLGEDAMIAWDESVRFQEDMDTYYAETWFGAPVSWQMCTHHGPKRAYEHIHPSEWTDHDKRSEGYRKCCNGRAWIATALVMRLMAGGIDAWRHDAFFDYCDRWMADPDPWAEGRGDIDRPNQETAAYEDWVTAMWRRYRAETEADTLSGHSRRWLWTMEDGKPKSPGRWEDNPRPEGLVIPNAAGQRPE